MQLNKVGISLIAFFGLAGAAFAIAPILAGAPGEVAGILASIGVIWVLVAAGLLWYARRQKEKAARNEWIFRQGLRGTATVLAAGSSAEVNEMPLMSLRLQLAVPGHGPAR
jgi:high-affinity Fe2+/Pb2+ permease